MSIDFLEKYRISNLVDLLRRRAEIQPDKIAYIFLVDGETEEIKLTYGELDRQAASIAAKLQSQFQPGDRALLLYPPGLEFISAFFGCLYAGVIAVPCYPPDPNKLDVSMAKLQVIIKDCSPEVILTTKEFLDLAAFIFPDYPELEKMNWLATDKIDSELSEEWIEPVIDGESLAFLQYTSGSTGDPKGVMISHGNIWHNQWMIKTLLEHDPSSTVFVSWIPLYHDMGLIGKVMHPIYLGIKCVLMSPIAFLQKPLRWLQALSRYKGTTTGAPNFAYDLCVKKIGEEDMKNLDLSCWERACNGAEPINPETLERFAEKFKSCGFRKEAVYPCYGMAEATLIISGVERKFYPKTVSLDKTSLSENEVRISEDAEATKAVGCGRSTPDNKVLIVDPKTKISLSDNQVGEIWVSGPSVSKGYWNNPKLSDEIFQARLADSGEGPFLTTGDMGFMKDGELFVTGRLKDLIIIRGKNYYPQDIELTAAASHPLLRSGCAAAFSVERDNEEKLIVVQEASPKYAENPDVEEVMQSIRKSVFNQHGLRIQEIVLIEAGSISKTSSGKIQRRLCRQNFLTDNLNAIERSLMNATDNRIEQPESFILKSVRAAQDHAEIRQSLLTLYLQEVISEVAEVPAAEIPIDEPIITIEHLGIDSFTAVEIVSRIEESLGNLEIELEDFFRGTLAETAKETDRLLAENNFMPKPLGVGAKVFDNGAI